MHAIETIKHAGKTITIHQDQDAESPREWSNAAVLACFHRRYTLGDKDHGYRSEDYNGWAEMRDAIVRDHKPVVILPLGLIDHSGISMYVGSGAHSCDPGGWDSGQVGFAYVTRESALKEWGKTRVTKYVREMAEKCLRGEVEAYDQYLRGDVYCYTIEDAGGETLDSLCGCYGLDYTIAEAKQAAESITTRKTRNAAECEAMMGGCL